MTPGYRAALCAAFGLAALVLAWDGMRDECWKGEGLR